MKLQSDWKRIVTKAHSIKFMVLAVLFSALEVGLPLYSEAFPRSVFAILSGLAVVGAMIFRVIAQKEFEK